MEDVTMFTQFPAIDELTGGSIYHQAINAPDFDVDEDDEGPMWMEAYKLQLDDVEGDILMIARNGSAYRLVVPELGKAYERSEWSDYLLDIDENRDAGESDVDAEAGEDDDASEDDGTLTSRQWDRAFDELPYVWGAHGPTGGWWMPINGVSDPVQAAVTLAGFEPCLVEVDDQYGLALTGGGTNMTWSIVAAYVALGQLPPRAYCDLPSIGSRGTSELDRYLLRAAVATLDSVRRSAEYERKALLERARMWADDAPVEVRDPLYDILRGLEGEARDRS